MATRRSHHSRETAERGSSSETPETAQEAPSSQDGGPGPEGNGTVSEPSPQRPVMQRAEELADRIGERVGHYASVFGMGILRFVARAREEAEDIWAEAQSIRKGRQGPPSPEA